jgi:hypothetical protein
LRYLGLREKKFLKRGGISRMKFYLYLDLRCEDLPSMSALNGTNAVAQICQLRGDVESVVGQTFDALSSYNPEFPPIVASLYGLCQNRWNRAIVLRCMHRAIDGSPLKMIGRLELTVLDIFRAQGQKRKLKLMHKLDGGTKQTCNGFIIVDRAYLAVKSGNGKLLHKHVLSKNPKLATYERQSECVVGLKAQHKHLLPFNKKTAPHYELFRLEQNGSFASKPMFRSEMLYKGGSSRWPPSSLPLHLLCFGDVRRKVLVKVFHNPSLGHPVLLGTAEFTLKSLLMVSAPAEIKGGNAAANDHHDEQQRDYKKIHLYDEKTKKKTGGAIVFHSTAVHSVLSDMNSLCIAAGIQHDESVWDRAQPHPPRIGLSAAMYSAELARQGKL